LKQLDNQITSKSPQAASSPLLQPQAGLGNVGSTIDAVMGDKFAAYASEIKRLTTASWKPQAVNSDVAPPARISFTLHRDGHVSNVRLVRRSGIAALDLSVQEAVEDARYPPLPPDFDKDTVQVEFTFEYRP
jgi:TonB family protein